MFARRILLATLGAAALLAAAPAAHADWYGPRDGWRERAYWAEQARIRAWREHEWRERHYREAYRYAPPPAPYYQPRW